MGLREEKKREQRRRILDATLGMFRERGLASTRVADVAALLRISEATFFNYFPSKQAVLESLVRDVVERSLVSATAGADQTLDRRLCAITAAIAAEFSADRPIARILAGNPHIMVSSWFAERSTASLEQLFAQAQDEGAVRADVPAAELAELFLAGALVAVRAAVVAPESAPDVDASLTRVVSVLYDGMRASPSSAEGRAVAS